MVLTFPFLLWVYRVIYNKMNCELFKQLIIYCIGNNLEDVMAMLLIKDIILRYNLEYLSRGMVYIPLKLSNH